MWHVPPVDNKEVVQEQAGLDSSGASGSAAPVKLEGAESALDRAVTSTPTPEENKEREAFRLRSIDLSVSSNQLVAIVGAVGSGKTSLLMAMVREMERAEGMRRTSTGAMTYRDQQAPPRHQFRSDERRLQEEEDGNRKTPGVHNSTAP